MTLSALGEVRGASASTFLLGRVGLLSLWKMWSLFNIYFEDGAQMWVLGVTGRKQVCCSELQLPKTAMLVLSLQQKCYLLASRVLLDRRIWWRCWAKSGVRNKIGTWCNGIVSSSGQDLLCQTNGLTIILIITNTVACYPLGRWIVQLYKSENFVLSVFPLLVHKEVLQVLVQNRRMVGIGGDLWRSPSSTPLLQQGQLE